MVDLMPNPGSIEARTKTWMAAREQLVDAELALKQARSKLASAETIRNNAAAAEARAWENLEAIRGRGKLPEENR